MAISHLIVVLLLLYTVFSDQKVANVPTIDYPIKFAYINLIDWGSADAIVSSLGVPDHSSSHSFNYIALTFLLCGRVELAADTALLWKNPIAYMGPTAKYGSTNDDIRTYLKGKYASKNIKLMVSAFGAT